MNKYTTAWTETRWEKTRGRNAKSILQVADHVARTIRELGSKQMGEYTELESECAALGACGIGGEGYMAMIKQASLNDDSEGKLVNGEHETMCKIGNKRGGD